MAKEASDSQEGAEASDLPKGAQAMDQTRPRSQSRASGLLSPLCGTVELQDRAFFESTFWPWH